MQQPSDKKESSSLTKTTTEQGRLSLGSQSIFSQNRKAPIKIKVNGGLLNKINSSKKFSVQTQIANGIVANRTVSRGGGLHPQD